ncbi:MAG: restriction endonuclease [Candidatus Sedimenticola sp. 6PFRAG5]
MITYDQLMLPLLKALVNLGGSGSIDEIYEEVVELESFDEETLAVLHNPEKSNQTEIGYRLAWARTYLKKAGYLENSSRGVWALTEKAKKADTIDSRETVNYVRSLSRPTKSEDTSPEDPTTAVDDLPEETQAWRERLHHILIEEMTPDAFERLTQRLLRESGFIHVEVTGRTGDGGIDGKGIARINGLMSFHIAFQCKKYKGSVSASDIRDFRGATVGRADRGMFITTGSFTKAAIEEANRDGAAPIDLVDGDQLADKLKELSLGIETELVEKVTVQPDWFLSL